MSILYSSTAVVLAVFAGGALLAFSRGARGLAAGLAAVALLPAATIVTTLSWPALVAVAGLAAVIVWHRWTRSSATVSRWASRSRRKVGVASSLDIVRHAGTFAVRRRTGTVRPSLSELPRWQRARLATTEAAVELCRTGALRVWALVEDVVIVVGGPRTGKTGWLAGRVLDAPGAALVTSTRTDLLDLCAPIRRQARGEVFVFNPAGLGDRTSTITFDPLTGCTDPVTATERATDMLAAVASGGGGDREFWDGQARRVLAALLHAAALGGRRMADVLGWVADPDAAGREVPALLRRSGVTAFEQDAMQFITTNERTRSSITSSVMPALGWLTHPAAAAAAEPGAGFDVARLLGERATVFLLGAEEAQTAPLVCALTGHIAREARRLAAGQPKGRLDPPLGLFLDEAALISPVPLESWTADMGGRGVTILCAFQSRAQLLARWGEHKAATILNNTAAVMLFGGTRDKADLEFWSTLAGERDERVSTTDEHGRVASRSVRKVPVLAPAQIANLPAGRVVVIRRGIAPVIGRARMAWTRRDVRAHGRDARRADARAARALQLDELRMWRDDVAQAALSVLATWWPDRFAERHERRRDANAMFRELAVIHDQSLHTPAAPRPGTDGQADR
ncbi:type IV secretory system conjugative DNA transfer family protein [Pseudonocardia sp. DR1-2]|uniref:type IV secretory system conjugative DNA transfer family protein n=1 Tax=Pseudonocardia sp. DR1-2 TaxID=2951168 RepID=UPI0020440DA4|nr:type IV secretory system conjugative DNA transfer family protein [Pseudonocardia sp. DR1-2]MCM3846325.1 type IV secretory system conjugative DNA transfer family protein [Pseudonocardia sp. DR1-2]